jgi:hypothetical protein
MPKILFFTSEDTYAVSSLIENTTTAVMKKIIFNLSVVIAFIAILTSCTKEEGVDDQGNSTGSNPAASKNGGLIINITWSTPQLILACGAMAFVDVEFQGPTSNFSRTYKQSPVRIDERLPIGKYTYTIIKKPVTGCSNFTPIVKTGTFTINSCPALCGNATNLKFTLD